jgi:hypothetical protein
LAQAQPLPRSVYGDVTLASSRFTGGMDELGAADWADYHRSIVVPNADPDRPFGGYAVTSRKRDKVGCPVHHAA